MKKGIKIAAFSLGALVAIFIGISIFIKIYFTPERVKVLIMPYAEKAMGRKVSVEDVKINLLTGVEISKVNIEDNPAFSSGPFLTADKFVLKYAFWPLFKKKLIIRKIIAVRPSILIKKNEQGVFNFSDLLQRIEAESKQPEEPESTKEPGSQVFLLLVSQAGIQYGRITYSDKTLQPSSPLVLEGINFIAKDISLTDPITVSLSAELPSGLPGKLPAKSVATVNLSGQVDPVSYNADLQLKIDSLDLKTFSPYYQQSIPVRVLSSAFNLQSRIKTEGAQKVQAEGEISLDDLKFLYPAATSGKEQTQIQGLGLKGDYALNVDMVQHLLKVERLNLTVMEIPVRITGQVANFNTQDKQIDVRLSASEIDLGKLKKTVPAVLLPKIMEKIALSGKLTGLQIQVGTGAGTTGQSQPLAYFGQGRISSMQVTYQPYPSLIPRIDGTFQFDRQKVQIPKLTIALFDSETILVSTVSDYLKEPRLNLQVDSQVPDLAKIYQALPPDLSPWLKKITVQSGGVKINASLTGNPAEISSLQYQGEALLRQIKIRPAVAEHASDKHASAEHASGDVYASDEHASDASMLAQIGGKVRFTEREINVENLNTSLPHSTLIFKGKVVDYRKTPIIQMDVTSPHVSLDEVLASAQSLTPQEPAAGEENPALNRKPAGEGNPPVKQGKQPPVKQGKQEPVKQGKQEPVKHGKQDTAPPPGGEKISAAGKIHLAEATYKTLTLRNVDMTYSLQNDILKWQNLKAETPGQGTIALDGMFDTSQKVYSAKVSLQSLSIQEPLLALAPKYASIFSGKISAQADMAGEGTTKDKIQQSLGLTGKFEVADGKIQNTDLGKALGALLPVTNWSELNFKTMKGKVEVEKGKIHLDSDLTKEDYILTPWGTIGLDNSLSMDILVKISPRLSQKNTLLSQYLTDDKGWAVIPIKAGGTLTKPKLTVDFKAVSKGVQEKLKEKFRENVEEKLKEKLQDKLQEKLKDKLFESLFFKKDGGGGQEGTQGAPNGGTGGASNKDAPNKEAPKPKAVEDLLKDTLKGFLKKGK